MVLGTDNRDGGRIWYMMWVKTNQNLSATQGTSPDEALATESLETPKTTQALGIILGGKPQQFLLLALWSTAQRNQPRSTQDTLTLHSATVAYTQIGKKNDLQ